MTATWSTLAPLPAPADLGADLDTAELGTVEPVASTGPTDPLRGRLKAAVGGRDWATMTWTRLLDALTALGRADIPLARLAEGHIDAVRILAQADRSPRPDAVYGVWASRSGGAGLTVTTDRDVAELTGTLPFASGAGLIDRALVTADDGGRAVLLDLPVRHWPFDPDSWRTSAMAESRSYTITLDSAPVSDPDRIGDVGFYLERPGFFPGGIGVAAVWLGGAARVGDLLGCRPDPAHRAAIGRIGAELTTGRVMLTRAAEVLGDGPLDTHPLAGPGQDGLRRLSTEVRSSVADVCRRVIAVAADTAGPAGLAHRPGLADALADLDIYVRQQHSRRDAEFLGTPAAG